MEGPFIRVLPSLKFSSNAYSIPQIGFGTWLIKDPQQCSASVKFALDAGYRHLDCGKVILLITSCNTLYNTSLIAMGRSIK